MLHGGNNILNSVSVGHALDEPRLTPEREWLVVTTELAHEPERFVTAEERWVYQGPWLHWELFDLTQPHFSRRDFRVYNRGVGRASTEWLPPHKPWSPSTCMVSGVSQPAASIKWAGIFGKTIAQPDVDIRVFGTRKLGDVNLVRSGLASLPGFDDGRKTIWWPECQVDSITAAWGLSDADVNDLICGRRSWPRHPDHDILLNLGRENIEKTKQQPAAGHR